MQRLKLYRFFTAVSHAVFWLLASWGGDGDRGKGGYAVMKYVSSFGDSFFFADLFVRRREGGGVKGGTELETTVAA